MKHLLPVTHTGYQMQQDRDKCSYFKHVISGVHDENYLLFHSSGSHQYFSCI